MVQESNDLSKDWDSDLIKFSSKHVLESAPSLKIAQVHGLVEDPVDILIDILPLPQNAVDMGDKDSVE